MSKLLDFFARANSANDDSVEEILRMADPDSFESQDDMSDHFEDVLGYDAFHHFDRKFVETSFDDIVNGAPFSVQDQLRSKKEYIIDRTIESVDEINENILQTVFYAVIKDEIGWSPETADKVSLDETINMVVFGEDVDDDEGSDSEDVDDEEEDEYSDSDEEAPMFEDSESEDDE